MVKKKKGEEMRRRTGRGYLGKSPGQRTTHAAVIFMQNKLEQFLLLGVLAISRVTCRFIVLHSSSSTADLINAGRPDYTISTLYLRASIDRLFRRLNCQRLLSLVLLEPHIFMCTLTINKTISRLALSPYPAPCIWASSKEICIALNELHTFALLQ